jgi:hypothetical protein
MRTTSLLAKPVVHLINKYLYSLWSGEAGRSSNRRKGGEGESQIVNSPAWLPYPLSPEGIRSSPAYKVLLRSLLYFWPKFRLRRKARRSTEVCQLASFREASRKDEYYLERAYAALSFKLKEASIINITIKLALISDR